MLKVLPKSEIQKLAVGLEARFGAYIVGTVGDSVAMDPVAYLHGPVLEVSLFNESALAQERGAVAVPLRVRIASTQGISTT